MKKFAVVLLGVSTLSLTGCISQEQADAKMIDGCKAAVAVMIAPNTIKEIKSSSAASETVMNDTYRRVKLTYTENEDFAESEKSGSCLFSEQWGMMKSSHAAMLEQVRYNDTMIGKNESGSIEGDMQAFMKLTESVGTAMGQQ